VVYGTVIINRWHWIRSLRINLKLENWGKFNPPKSRYKITWQVFLKIETNMIYMKNRNCAVNMNLLESFKKWSKNSSNFKWKNRTLAITKESKKRLLKVRCRSSNVITCTMYSRRKNKITNSTVYRNTVPKVLSVTPKAGDSCCAPVLAYLAFSCDSLDLLAGFSCCCSLVVRT